MTSRNGIVTRDMERRGRRAQAAARRLAPTPRFARTIRYEIVPRGNRHIVVLNSTHKAAIFVIGGTRRHIIRPRKKGGFLRFKVAGGRVVYARIVHHPGNKPNNFMAKALREAVGR